MQIAADGTMKFDDQYELNYELLNQLEMELRPDGTIYDTVSNNILSFNDMIIKASIKPNDIHYPGQGEVEFNILENVRMITVLFGLYLERRIKDGMPFISYYPEEQIIVSNRKKIPDMKMSNLTVRFDTTHETATPFYYNKCLKFIDMIFRLEDESVDLSNFDQEEYERKINESK